MTHTRRNWQIPLLELDKDPMGDNDDGSSEAAQSAQSETDIEPPQTDTPKSGGFLSRVFEALSPSDGDNGDTDTVSDTPPSRSGHGMINLRRMRVEDVAIPKADIVAVPSTISLDELVEVFKDSGMTRLPVFEGGVDGLVTIEDLIEQVIGEIEDEHDVDEGQFFNLDAAGDGYLALAKTPLEDFETEIGQSLTDHEDVDAEEIDTLGGLVFMLAGRVPARGEVVVHPEGPEFEVIDADPRRIKRLRVRLPGQDDDA